MALSAALDIGIKGSAAQKHVLGQIMIHAVHHQIATPRDSKTGMPSGDPQHGSLTVTKNVDLSSPELRAAMLSGKLIGRGTLSFYRLPPAGGQEETHYSIIITGVRIVSIRLMSPNTTIPSESMVPDLEEVRLTYKDITWKYHGTERGSNGNNTKVNVEGSEEDVNPAPDELEAWAKGMLLGAQKELEGYIRNTVKTQIASLISEIKGGSGTEPPAEQ